MEIKIRYRLNERLRDGHWEIGAWETARFDDDTDAELYVASLANEVLKAQSRGRHNLVEFGPNVLKCGVLIESTPGGGIQVSARRTGYVPRGVSTLDRFGSDVVGAARAVLRALAEPRRANNEVALCLTGAKRWTSAGMSRLSC